MSKLSHGSEYPTLMIEGARRKAVHVMRDAGALAYYVRQIQELPEWDTEAEEAAKQAETALTEALLAVKLVNHEFTRRRVEAFGIAAE